MPAATPEPIASILWTRVSGATGEVPVRWVLSANPTFTRVVARGETPTGAARDFTVKIDVSGLAAATTYYYRFEALGARSATGRTRTLPAGGAGRVRLALASCANYPHGYFNVYGRIAARPDIDAVLHLGDYFYEYEQGRYFDKTLTDRGVDPPHEITALDDYRRRYALYRSDPDLQEAHRQHPFIAVWDDHEIANNTWSTGADNHQPADGDFTARRNAAYQAFLEWLPVRDTGSARQPLIYRSFALGDLADLVMLDTRLAGRDVQVERTNVLGIEDPRRTILGAAQEHWLDGELRESVRAGTRWQILGQQVMFAPQTPYNTTGGNPDSWDGYRASRSHVYDMVERHQVPNLVVLTGDVHSSWAFDLPRQLSDRYDPATGRESLGVEIVCPAVSSPSAVPGPRRRGPAGRDPEDAAAPQVPRRPLARLRGARGHARAVAGRLVVRAGGQRPLDGTAVRQGAGQRSRQPPPDRRRLADGGGHGPRPRAVAPAPLNHVRRDQNATPTFRRSVGMYLTGKVCESVSKRRFRPNPEPK